MPNILMNKLGLRTPIVQAPMAGASNADFVVAACQAGALGSLGAGMMSPDAIADEIAKIKAQTKQAFAVNLMVLDDEQTSKLAGEMPEWLAKKYAELGITPTLDEKPAHDFKAQFAAVLDNPAPVVSFTFGIIDKNAVQALKDKGCIIIGTANYVDEVLAWQAVGADAVVVQGAQAGGHQGGWLHEADEKLDTLTLVEQAKAASDIPLIAAGGIATAEQVAAALAAGADLVAVGTAFLTTHESVISTAWQERLLAASGADTQFTRLFSGKVARGITNDFLREFAQFDGLSSHSEVRSYPTQNAMTKALRAYAGKAADSELMSLWAGTAVAHCQRESIAHLVARLCADLPA
ncbi:hypothetical protein B0181_08895 [Moraxella caviae]|uniref:Propionate 3-nitronate monooxygenase n=2 Tax=Moraxella caviae TaxID=34060 RepID=A0A1S9ZXC4_9GAMM|nr:nitronate monooxygenase [Moraxella caviae]OOR88115.1 hypothetical protein B0181_08895 [Moraxella caviae]STZ10001.1 Nitronate monooxygenase [Moraxella caviae]VEW12948.1 Nitronate monooxygenase [Moraxella caviae]